MSQIFDLTDGEDFLQMIQEKDEQYGALMVAAKEICYERVEPEVETDAEVQAHIVAMDLQADEECVIQCCQDEAQRRNVLMTVGSGADISVLPESHASIGVEDNGIGKIMMRDAQGKVIGHSGVRRP